jgi:hypothetical protein
MATDKPKGARRQGAETRASAEDVPDEGTAAESVWDLRRAEMTYWRESQAAALDHQHRAAAALSEYQQALTQIADEASGEELAALDAAAAMWESADREIGKAPQAAQELRARVTSARIDANRRLRAAARSLAEAQHRSWLDAVERQNDAYADYQAAMQRSYVPAAWREGPSTAFAIPGDEGDVTLPGAAWAPRAAFGWPHYQY